MKIRSASVFTGAAALTLLATACGGGDTGGETQAAAEDAMVIWADDERTDVLLPFAEEFGDAHGVEVEVQAVPNDELQSSFVTAHQAGSGPDIVVGAHDWTGNFVQNGAIDPIQLPQDTVEAFAPTAIEAVTYNDQLYGVPYAMENLVLIRNTDLAPEEPASVEEMVEAGTGLRDAGDVEEIMGLQVGQVGDPYHIHPFYTSAGGYLFGRDDNGDYDPTDLGVGTDESIAAFERIAELGEEGSGALKRSIDDQNVASLFNDGRTAYFVTGPWSLPDIRTAGIPYEISAVPGFEGGEEARPFVSVQTFYVAAGGANKVLAQEFVTNYVAKPELAVALYESDPRPPALTAALEQIGEDDPDLAKVVAAGENGDPLPAIPQMAAIWDPFGKAEASVIGGADPEETVTAAGETIADQIG
ncbi:arabinogalactan oligomer/maltooligosaccharide transport system substrate-binding protein [Spinactinospora alkalitolerans]|uniref:Arabinogalactan oligomer/maltooligosaccharide transport system substrate-binding protein n=1 Tax=Spinactinospora alkalitolerans TaxID=687207 RepID=A0A852TX51_9ACTN|nr:maltose ABC transporter substrate-binding protein [Spinactinospora alkalitolerans]NYE49086.1 arabinogalactan oligomer/maltooligosaccharide transport system substrate-binding protein [Spinactinospora alkalitolerans]